MKDKKQKKKRIDVENIENIENISPKENDSKLDKTSNNKLNEISKLKDILARTQADYANFKTRVERDREDMIYYLKADIFKKILPIIDDIERIISQTPEPQRDNWVYEWVLSIQKKLIDDLEKQWVKCFDSIWSEIDPNKHEVMTQLPWKDWIILEEFEKWYLLWDKILRVAKVIVWQWD